MDERQVERNPMPETATDLNATVQNSETVSEPATVKPVTAVPTKPWINPFVFPLLAVAFVAVTVMIFILAKQSSTLVTEMQQLLYPLLAGMLIGGLTVLWLIHQVTDKDRFNVQEKPWFFPVFGGALTLILAVLAYMCIGMWPVGEKSAMIVDMHHQYAPMLAQLRDMILHGGSPLYSFEVGTGTSFIPLFAYYLASPLNLLLLLFPVSYLAEGILIITLIKMTLAGAFMTLCIQYVYKRREYSAVIIGVMYALMMYMLAYSWDIMWLDCVMFLPLVILGFEHMMRTGKYLLYILSLAYTLYANYYIGFMVCIFMVLYYFVFFFRVRRNGVKQAVGFARFAIGSAIGGGLAMFILVPTFLSLASTSAAGGTLPAFSTNFNVYELFSRGLYGVEPTIRSGNLPNTYCGVLAVLALPIFATLSSIPLRRRLAYLGLFGFMGISLVFNQLDLVWHGLHAPNDLPYRYSFLFSFALLLITADVLYRIRDIKPIQIAASVFGIAVYLIIEEHFGSEELSYASIYISFLLIAIYGLIMLLVNQKKLMIRSAYALMLVIVTAEMLFNASATFEMMNNNEHFTNHDSYLDNDVSVAVQGVVDQMEAIGDEAAQGDFYRMEFIPRRTTADTALFDYRGITVFASSGSYDMTRFMGSLGYDVNGVNSQLYQSYVPTADALLGVKYVAKESYVAQHPQLVSLDKEVSVQDYKYRIYENPYALSVGYMVKDSIKDFAYDYYNPINSQNKIYQAMTGTTENVLDCKPVTSLNTDLANMTGDNSFSFTGAHTAVFSATAETRDEYYIYVDCRAAKTINVSAADRNWGVTTYQPYIIDAGILEPGTEINVTVSTEQACGGNIYIATLNEEVFKKDIDILKTNMLKVEEFNDSNLRGNIHVDQDGVLCTSVQYDEGWSVYVDGKKVRTFAIGDALLGVDLTAGDHVVEMKFMPRGLLEGILLSAFSLVALLVLMDYVKMRDTGKSVLPIFKKKS